MEQKSITVAPAPTPWPDWPPPQQRNRTASVPAKTTAAASLVSPSNRSLFRLASFPGLPPVLSACSKVHAATAGLLQGTEYLPSAFPEREPQGLARGNTQRAMESRSTLHRQLPPCTCSVISLPALPHLEGGGGRHQSSSQEAQSKSRLFAQLTRFPGNRLETHKGKPPQSPLARRGAPGLRPTFGFSALPCFNSCFLERTDPPPLPTPALHKEPSALGGTQLARKASASHCYQRGVSFSVTLCSSGGLELGMVPEAPCLTPPLHSGAHFLSSLVHFGKVKKPTAASEPVRSYSGNTKTRCMTCQL